MYKVSAFDQNHIPRVWGTGKTKSEALVQCAKAIIEYERERKDCTLTISGKIEKLSSR